METDFFRDREMIPAKLCQYGFSSADGIYTWSTNLSVGKFVLTVTVTPRGKIQTRIIDPASGDDYVLFRISSASGAFVGEVRAAYAAVMNDIMEKCSLPNVFKSSAAKRVIQYVRKKYQDELEFLWRRFPRNAVFRRPDNKKWYAALLVLAPEKLGLPAGVPLDIIDLRIPPADAVKLIDRRRYFPGYHMNKKNWLTLCLDGSLPLKEIYHRIDASYKIAAQ